MSFNFNEHFGGSLERMVSELPDNFVQCRDFGHSWRNLTAKLDDDKKYFTQLFSCTRCSTQKTRYISANGDLLYGPGSGYTYPDKYLVKGVGHLRTEHRSIVRLSAVMSVLR